MNPPDEKRPPTSPQAWLAHADSDLTLAIAGKNNESVLPEQICFHAQQAAEKALKAVLVHRRVDFPLTHDIEQLLQIAEHAGIDLPNDVSLAGTLTPYAVETRYPGFWQPITDPDVDEALGLAEQILVWAKRHVAKDNTG